MDWICCIFSPLFPFLHFSLLFFFLSEMKHFLNLVHCFLLFFRSRDCMRYLKRTIFLPEEIWGEVKCFAFVLNWSHLIIMYWYPIGWMASREFSSHSLGAHTGEYAMRNVKIENGLVYVLATTSYCDFYVKSDLSRNGSFFCSCFDASQHQNNGQKQLMDRIFYCFAAYDHQTDAQNIRLSKKC